MSGSEGVQGGKDSALAQPKQCLNVVVLRKAKKEGHEFLNPGQYEHMTGVIKRLVDFNSPMEITDLRIEPIESFYELKDKGGLLGKINVRIYFAYVPDEGNIVVLKAYKKEEEGKVPRHVVITVLARLRSYLKDGACAGATIYKADVSL